MNVKTVLSCVLPLSFIIGCTDANEKQNGATAIKITEENVTLIMEESIRLTVEVEPADADVIWTSSNPVVASVDNDGLVTANVTGQTTVTASSGEVSSSCTVTVIGQPAESITLDITEATLPEGDSIQLVATVLPEDTYDMTVTWESDNTETATVDGNGKVIAEGPGNATITARTGDVSATCSITVTDTPDIGDYYYADGTFSIDYNPEKEVIGIIFWINDDKESGKILQMQEASLVWGERDAEVDNYDRADGKGNTANIMSYVSENGKWDAFPAFEYINGLDMGGLDWYLPSTLELKQLYCAISGSKWTEGNDWPDEDVVVLNDEEHSQARAAFNDRISEAGGTIINMSGYTYFSSTSVDNQTAWQINLKFGVGYNMGRNGTNRVRGIAEF